MNLRLEPLDAEQFAPFGTVINQTADSQPMAINSGSCMRFDDLARADTSHGAAGFSIFEAEAQLLPLPLVMFERHPHGSQAFLPMTAEPYLIIVAPGGDKPELPRARAFECKGTAVNIGRNIWHHPLIALQKQSFWVVDAVGTAGNLEVFNLPEPLTLFAS